jgi:F0F1-type ATP synthase delta subunit
MNKQAKIKSYAKALAEVINSGKVDDKKIVSNFTKFLISSGYISKAKEILDLAEDFILAKNKNRRITIETARKATINQKKMLERFVKSGDVVKEKVNPELIAGVKIIINDSKQFDSSLQSKLQNIYVRRNN